jgi:hypothetical protein
MEGLSNFQENVNENVSAPRVEVEPGFIEYVPQEFMDDPLGYFEHEGKNIKNGERKFDEAGEVREDPTAVKDLPDWKNATNEILSVVGKRVNIAKGAVGESGDPFYEYTILERLSSMELPAARAIAKAEQNGTHIIVMERVPGIRWSERDSLQLKEKGYSDEDIASLFNQAEEEMQALKARFEASGIVRSWKLKDMVIQVDVENKKILSLTPTDWERTTIVEISGK